MAKVTNNTRQTLNFNKFEDGKYVVKDGEPVTVSVKEGVTDEIPIDLDSEHVRGFILSGAITVSGRSAAKAEKVLGGAQSPAA